MKRCLTIALLISWGCLVWTDSAAAQNPNARVTVYLKSSSEKQPTTPGFIAEETAKGVRLKARADMITEGEIFDIDYSDQMEGTKGLTTYRPALQAEKEARSAKTSEDRQKHWKTALAKYQEAAGNMAAKLYAARRHMDFKIGFLHGQLALETDNLAERKLAVNKLEDFKKKHPDSWQFPRAMRLLAKLHALDDDFDAVQQTLKALADADVSDQVKHESQFLLADLLMNAEKYAEAQKSLQALMTALPKNSPLYTKAQLAEAAAMAAAGDNLDEAVKKLKTVLNEAKDKKTRASAYNTLGECYLRQDMLQEARWQFLWVDVIYNDDKQEHARALYHLWRVFDRLREFDRSQEFYSTLVNNDEFAGTQWYRKAIEEARKLQQ